MLMTPTLFQDIQFQIMKITNLSQEVTREMAKADRQQRLAYEHEAQKLKAQALRAKQALTPASEYSSPGEKLREEAEHTVTNTLRSLRTL